MAIDDNTSYELTGAQVKDLANKIKAKAADNIFVGATSAAPGSKGLVPQPQAGDESKVLSGAGTWVNQPTVPTVNDGTLTIQHNGTTKGTFTANQSTASTVNIETIYADTPGTATTPAASVQASDIVWSTMPFNYSTTEVDTGTTWIDGKPIYKKTVYFASVASGDVNSAHGISNLSLAIKYEAFFISGGACIPVPSLANTSGGNYFAIWSINATNIHTFSSVTLNDFYVTLWYTKTS